MEDGVTFFSGLRFVHNPDGTKGWYKPNEHNQPGGVCATDATGRHSTSFAFTISDPTIPTHYGPTWRPEHFQLPTTVSLGNPEKDPGLLTVAQIELYRNTGGVTVLHEFAHLVNDSKTILYFSFCL